MKSRQEILALLRDFKVRKGKKYGILKMGIFGSVARDQQTESSDVDIYYGTHKYQSNASDGPLARPSHLFSS